MRDLGAEEPLAHCAFDKCRKAHVDFVQATMTAMASDSDCDGNDKNGSGTCFA